MLKAAQKYLGKFATVFQSEVTGIIGCCQEIRVNKSQNSPVNIFTDSQAALKALNGCKFTSSVTLNCRDLIQSLALLREINLIWVPGHCGISGNEKADELGGIASSTPFLGPEPGLPESFSTQQKFITDWTLAKILIYQDGDARNRNLDIST